MSRRRRRSEAAAVFAPSDIPGLIFNLDASDGSTIFQDAAKTLLAGDNDVVGAWGDLSGLVNDLLQTVTAQKPTYNSAGKNDLGTITFDGADDNLVLSTFADGPITQPNTFFIVFRLIAPLLEFRYIFDSSDAGNRQTFLTTPTPSLDFNAGVTQAIPGTVPDTSWHSATIVVNGVSSTLYFDGIFKISNDFGANSLVGLTLGARYNLISPLQMVVAETLLYDMVVSVSDIAKMHSYFDTKWGLALP